MRQSCRTSMDFLNLELTKLSFDEPHSEHMLLKDNSNVGKRLNLLVLDNNLLKMLLNC
jgi:hypothetical protein